MNTFLLSIGVFVVIAFIFIMGSASKELAGLIQGFILVSILLVLLNNAKVLQSGESSAFGKIQGAEAKA